MNLFAQAPDFNDIEGALGTSYRFRGAGRTLGEFFNLGIVNIVFFIAGVAFLIFLISGGLSLMLSRGDPKNIEVGKARITNALIGLVIIFTAYWIVQVVGLLLGIPGFKGVF